MKRAKFILEVRRQLALSYLYAIHTAGSEGGPLLYQAPATILSEAQYTRLPRRGEASEAASAFVVSFENFDPGRHPVSAWFKWQRGLKGGGA